MKETNETKDSGLQWWGNWAREELRHLINSEEVSIKLENAIKEFIDTSEIFDEEEDDFIAFGEHVETLINCRPLTQLTGADDEWRISETWKGSDAIDNYYNRTIDSNKDKFIKFVHKRFPSLVKTDTGKVIDYSVMYPIAVHTSIGMVDHGIVRDLYLDFFDKHPIEFPYTPGERKWRAYLDIVEKGGAKYVAWYKYRNVYTNDLEDINYFYTIAEDGEKNEITMEDFKKVLRDDS